MSDTTKETDKKKMTVEQRLELLEAQMDALTARVDRLFSNALWERACKIERPFG